MRGQQETCSGLVLSLSLFLLFGDCVRGDCPVPTLKPGVELPDDSLDKTSFPEGATVTLQCGRGYSKSVGNGKITCNSGVWTAETLQCQKRSCGPPGDILNGHFTIPDGIDFGATVTASCNPGYLLVGPVHRQCYEFGWSNRVPTCEIVKCEDPPNIVNGRITSQPAKEFPEYRDIIEYSCDKDYNLVGDAAIVCNEAGKYDGTIPSCTELNCPPPMVNNSFRVEGGPPPYKLKYFVVYKCQAGYEMQGSSKVVCEAEGWSPGIPICVESRKPAPTQKPGPTTPGQKEATSAPPRPPGTTPPPDNKTGLKIGVGVGVALIVALVLGCVLYKCVPLLKKKGQTY